MITVAFLAGLSPRVAHADPAPAGSPAEAALLAGGWLARQVTADGQLVGSAEADIADEAWAVLGMHAAGVGADAASRVVAHLTVVLASVGPDDMAVDSLALTVLALQVSGLDPRDVGPEGLDLVAELESRQQQAGVDAGLVGTSSVLAAPVRGHALAMLALQATAAEEDPARAAWLAGQQCPTGGWPTYRDAAARQTGTCELIVPDVWSTMLATQAMRGVDRTEWPDMFEQAQAFLHTLGDGTGAFASAPGLTPTPPDTAAGLLAVLAVGGDPGDGSWAGSRGSPQDVLLAEQLGCGWHGRDRGAIPVDMRDDPAAPVDPPDPPAPGEAAGARPVTWLVLAATSSTLPLSTAPPRVGDPFPNCPVEVMRSQGAGRVETAVALSQAAFPDGAPAVAVATARGYADALAGASLAGSLGGPILLTEPGAAPGVLLDELARLGPQQVVILGGPDAVSVAAEEQLAAVEGVEQVRRVSGPNRFATAAAIADEVGGTRAFVVRGAGPDASAPWADALAVGAWSATAAIPVLLTEADRLPEETSGALEDIEVATIVGGTMAVSEAVAEALALQVPQVSRLAGSTRYQTSARVLVAAFEAGVDARSILLATGADYPDALAAGASAAQQGGTLLLVDPTTATGGEAAEGVVQGLDYLVDRLVSIGGPVAVPDGIAESLAVVARHEAAN